MILLLVITLTATGCSFKSVYNRMDFLIAEYVEGLVTLDDVLESDLENRSTLLLDWHRTTQLQQYADWFRELQSDVGPGLDDKRLIYHQHKIEIYWKNISSRINADMAEFLPRLSAEQIEELFASLDDKNEDFREEYVEIDDAERLEKYIDTITDNYEDWFGELSDQQLTFVEEAASKLKSSAQRRLQLRMRWQSTIKTILSAEYSETEKEKLLLKYFNRDDINNDPELRATDEANKNVLRGLTRNLVHTMDVDQRSYFIDRTDEYIRMFEELADNQ